MRYIQISHPNTQLPTSGIQYAVSAVNVYTECFCEGVSTGIQSEGSLYHTKHADGGLTPIHQYFRRAIALIANVILLPTSPPCMEVIYSWYSPAS